MFTPKKVQTFIGTKDSIVTVVRHDTITTERIKIKYIDAPVISDIIIGTAREQVFGDSIGNKATLLTVIKQGADSTVSCKLDVIEKEKEKIIRRDSIVIKNHIEYKTIEQKPQLLVGGSVGYNPFLGKIAIEGSAGLLNKTNIIPIIGFIQTNTLYLKVGIQVKLK